MARQQCRVGKLPKCDLAKGAHALSTSGPHCECCTCRRVRFGANRDGKRTSGPCGLPGNAAGQR